MSYRFSRKAHADLLEISRYIAKDNPQAADDVIEEIEKTCQTCAEMPGIGKRPEYIDNGAVQVIPTAKYKDYLVFYTTTETGIYILRVLHGARDLPALFND